MNNKNYGVMVTFSLIAGLLLARAEIVSALALQESDGALFSKIGLLAIILYSVLSATGLLSLIARFWLSKITVDVFSRFGLLNWARWLVFSGSLAFLTWVYLYSPWQFILTGGWTQFIVAIAFAELISTLISPRQNKSFGWSELALAVSVFLYPRLVNETRLLTDSSLASRLMILIGYGYIVGLAFALFHSTGERIAGYLRSLRERMNGKVRWLVIMFFWFTPIIYHYVVGAEINTIFTSLRFTVLLLAAWFASFFWCEQKDRMISTDALVVNLGILVFASAIDDYLMLSVSYPFGLYWSEGNRLYDYSLVFGQSLYNYPGIVVNPYSSPGRYGLWGAMFLIKDLPIWVHRFWNLILQIVPPILFSWLITRKIQPTGLRYRIMLWIALFFIVLAPLHPPFMLASIVVAWFAFDESPVKRGISVLLAGYYVAITRWTWAFAPAAMGALIDLFLYYPRRSGNWFRRLLPTAILALLGMAPGLYINFGAFQSTLQGESITGKQALLWYRLLPNPTLGPGVLLLVLLYTSPLLIFIAWWMYTKRWKLDIWQKLAAWGALTGFFTVGLIVSTKIGGGGDLHNLDMYLVTLMLVFALGLTEVSKSTEKIYLPVWAIGLITLLILFPVYKYIPITPSTGESGRLGFADRDTVQKVLSTIQSEVETASQNGEVLFMDQRQLLTFGYVLPIPLVPEYEKKYMMDQAMANNAAYFQPYYQDLANKRFTLIVTEILRMKRKSEMGGRFGEENDAFVNWVSNPTLCFYKPIYTSSETNIMLLVPKSNPKGCEEYLNQISAESLP